MRTVFLQLCMLLMALTTLTAAAGTKDYILGAGDVVKITVFDSPDLTTEARIADGGKIRFPLVGEVVIGGLSANAAEAHIAELLKSNNAVLKPNVNLNVIQYHSQQVSVIGQVNRPGRYPIDGPSKVSDMLAAAGGIGQLGADMLTLTRSENGTPKRIEINQLAAFERGDMKLDIPVEGGDVIFVPRAAMFYIHGEVQRPGQFRIEPNMTVAQALSVGGGVTQRGTTRGIKLTRRNENAELESRKVKMDELLRPDDVLYVNESLF